MCPTRYNLFHTSENNPEMKYQCNQCSKPLADLTAVLKHECNHLSAEEVQKLHEEMYGEKHEETN